MLEALGVTVGVGGALAFVGRWLLGHFSVQLQDVLFDVVEDRVEEGKFKRLLEWVAVAAYGASEAALREFLDGVEDGVDVGDAVSAWDKFKDTLLTLMYDSDKARIFGTDEDEEISKSLDDFGSRNSKIVRSAIEYTGATSPNNRSFVR